MLRLALALAVAAGALHAAPALSQPDRKEARKDAKEALKDRKEARKDAKEALKDRKEAAKDAKEDAREAAKDAREDAREAAKDAREEAKEDRKEAREERKEDRADARRARVGKAMSVEVENEKHADRLARIARLEERLKAAGRPELLDQTAAMRAKELKRHERALARLAKGAAK